MKRNKILTLVATILLVIGALELLDACANTINGPAVDSETEPEIKKPEMVYIEANDIDGGFNGNEWKWVFDINRKIRLDGFYIGKYEVSQELYQVVMTDNEKGLSANPSVFPKDFPEDEILKTHPVENITWYDAVYFCNELTKKIMKEKDCVYTIDNIKIENGHIMAADVSMDLDKIGYRLPTEVEWEYAARSGYMSAGNPYEEYQRKIYAWYKINSSGRTHPVGQKLKNPIELYDIVGNVEEWCWDWYEKPITKKTDAEGNILKEHNPKGPETGSERVKRGGGWNTEKEDCDLEDRSSADPKTHEGYIGLRLARSDYYY